MYTHDASTTSESGSGSASRGQPGKRTLTQSLARSGTSSSSTATSGGGEASSATAVGDGGGSSSGSGGSESESAVNDAFSVHLLGDEADEEGEAGEEGSVAAAGVGGVGGVSEGSKSLERYEQDAASSSSVLAEVHAQLESLAPMLPSGAKIELAMVSDEAMGFDDEMWEALDAAGEGDGEPDEALLDEIDLAIARVELATELLEAYYRLWQAYLAANVAALLQSLVGLTLTAITALHGQICMLEVQLRTLEAAVRAAKQDLAEVALQTGLDLVFDFGLPALLVALGVTNPFVGAAIAVSGFLLTWNADNLLGVDADGAFGQLNDLNGKIEGTAALSEGTLSFFEGTKNVVANDHALKAATEATGKACDMFGLALDAWEAKIGYENLAALRAEVQSKTHRAQLLLEMWNRVAPYLGTLQHAAIGLRSAVPLAVGKMGDELSTIGGLRRELAAVGG